jgi:hypothetical protein
MCNRADAGSLVCSSCSSMQTAPIIIMLTTLPSDRFNAVSFPYPPIKSQHHLNLSTRSLPACSFDEQLTLIALRARCMSSLPVARAGLAVAVCASWKLHDCDVLCP